MWQDRRDAAHAFSRPFCVQAKRMAAYYAGYQWLEVSNSMQDRFDVRVREKRADYEVRLTINYFRRLVNAVRSRLLVERPRPEAVPSSDTDGARQAARVADQFLRAWDARWDAHRKYESLGVAVVAAGLGWFCDDWDPQAEGLVADAAGQPKRLAAGEITSELLPPWDVYWEPQVAVDASSYYVRRAQMSVDDVRAAYPDRAAFVVVSDENAEYGGGGRSEENADLERCLLAFSGEGGGEQDTDEPGKAMTTVWQGYEKYTDERGDERWRLFTWTGETWLAEADVTWQPLVPVVFDSFLGLPYPMGLGQDLASLQDRVNIDRSRVQEHLNLCTHPKILEHTGSAILDEWTNEPGQRIRYSGQQKPEYLTPPPLKPEVLAEPERLAYLMADLAGAHDVTQGKMPNASTSGRAVALLREQDAANMSHAVAHFKAALAKHYENLLEIAREKYTEPRWLAQIDDDLAADVSSFTGSDVALAREVHLTAGSSIPMQPAERREFVAELQRGGLLMPERRDELRAYLSMLEYEAPPAMSDARAQAVKRAQQEHRELEKTSQMRPPLVEEDHAAHLEQHKIFLNSERFRRLNAVQQQGMRHHAELHENVAGILAAEMQQMEGYVASGGGKMAGGVAAPEAVGAGAGAGPVPVPARPGPRPGVGGGAGVADRMGERAARVQGV